MANVLILHTSANAIWRRLHGIPWSPNASASGRLIAMLYDAAEKPLQP